MTPPDGSLILIMICFWIAFWLVQRFLIAPIQGVLAERRGRVVSAEREWETKNQEYLAATQRLEAELDEAARQAARVRAEHRQGAQQARQERLDAARDSAETALDAALAELDRDAEAAREELRRRARVLAEGFAERLLGRELAS